MTVVKLVWDLVVICWQIVMTCCLVYNAYQWDKTHDLARGEFTLFYLGMLIWMNTGKCKCQ